MSYLDWHADRSGLYALHLHESANESVGIDLKAVRHYRLSRVREQMRIQGIDALILSDPVNIRYATGTRNMQIFSARNTPSRYLLLTQDDSILYEFTGCEHLANGFDTLTEVRPAFTASFVAAGNHIVEREKAWANHISNTIRELTGGFGCVGMERLNAGSALALNQLGHYIVDAQFPVEMARSIKSSEEVKCVIASLRATERGVAKLQQAITPGISEAELWSILHQSVISDNGDYCETRLLNSGQRTNPWFQETSSKIITNNELIALDTDVVGCHGYYSDFSRTFHSGPDKPTAKQRELYQTAYDQVHHNINILKPGLHFSEYAELAWDIPQRYFANRYYLSSHGCGMTGEYPYLYHRADYATAGYEGEILPGMVICVESYIGEHNDSEGVKLEQQVLITDTGVELLSLYPFEQGLLSFEI